MDTGDRNDIPPEMLKAVADAMEAKRRELIAKPLAQIWPALAETAIAAAADARFQRWNRLAHMTLVETPDGTTRIENRELRAHNRQDHT